MVRGPDMRIDVQGTFAPHSDRRSGPPHGAPSSVAPRVSSRLRGHYETWRRSTACRSWDQCLDRGVVIGRRLAVRGV